MVQKLNLVGRQFYNLTVIRYVGRTEEGKALWECACSCGNTRIVSSSALMAGQAKYCSINNHRIKPILNQETLKKHLQYNQETGVFTWLTDRGYPVKRGDVAGTVSSHGYIMIKFLGRFRAAHRLAWLYVYGRFPIADIDHINGIRDDNRFSNLREASRSQNIMNSKIRSNNTSGIKGVCWHKGVGKWVAVCRVKGICKHIGVFTTKEAAAFAYKEYAMKAHGQFYREK